MIEKKKAAFPMRDFVAIDFETANQELVPQAEWLSNQIYYYNKEENLTFTNYRNNCRK